MRRHLRQSIAPGHILTNLENSTEAIPALTLEICEQFIETQGEAANDFRTHLPADTSVVSKLIFRTYHQQPIEAVASRCLNLIDNMCEQGKCPAAGKTEGTGDLRVRPGTGKLRPSNGEISFKEQGRYLAARSPSSAGRFALMRNSLASAPGALVDTKGYVVQVCRNLVDGVRASRMELPSNGRQ